MRTHLGQHIAAPDTLVAVVMPDGQKRPGEYVKIGLSLKSVSVEKLGRHCKCAPPVALSISHDGINKAKHVMSSHPASGIVINGVMHSVGGVNTVVRARPRVVDVVMSP